MRRAKIVCTIGPASNDRETLTKMIEAGMDVARLNMSHGDHDSHSKVIELIRDISREKGREIAILMDLAGPKIRLGILKDPVSLHAGDLIRLTTEDVEGEGDILPVSYPYLTSELEVGDRLSMIDGLIHLEVVERGDKELKVRVLNGGTVLSRKGVNLPTGGEGLPAMTEKDERDLRFGLGAGVDLVSLSFVRNAADCEGPYRVMDYEGVKVPLIAKIEKRQALENLDEIIDAFDGLMVARGDLGVEVELEDVPAIQKRVIKSANRAAKPVITATQMLLSMVTNAMPTRAEVTDVANAIVDGSDAVMLSEETAMGKDPVLVVKTMSAIAGSAASIEIPQVKTKSGKESVLPTNEAIAKATRKVAESVDASVIVTPTTSGSTARLISAMRPGQRILALSTSVETVRQLSVVWGVTGILIPHLPDMESLLGKCRDIALDTGAAKSGDRIVITAGVPLYVSNTTNLLKIVEA